MGQPSTWKRPGQPLGVKGHPWQREGLKDDDKKKEEEDVQVTENEAPPQVKPSSFNRIRDDVCLLNHVFKQNTNQ